MSTDERHDGKRDFRIAPHKTDVGPPWLVAMKGFPATGKSALAHVLCRTLAWPLIDKDDVKDFTLHFENGNELAYEIMWSITRRQLSLGLSVVVDSPLTYPIAFATAATLASEYKARLLVVETRLDDNTWRQRLEARNPSESTHKVSSWDAMQQLLRRYDGCWQYAIPEGQHIIVDASLPADLLLRDVMARLELSLLEQPYRSVPTTACD
jgi:predicted kinase